MAESTIQPASQMPPIDGRAATGLVMMLIGTLWTILAYPGLLKLQLKAVRGEQPDAVECLKQGLPRLVPFIMTTVLVAILLVFGLIAFIIPGLILLRGFYLSMYYVVDRNLGPVDALKQSYNDSKPHAGYIWGLIGVALIIAFLSSGLDEIPVVGYVLSLAFGYIYSFAPAIRYNEITSAAPELPKDPAYPKL
ncbi:MAG TPA: hypothetical protein VF575_01965 [Candidatus Saccharimonadales bacterium]|jgi:uncharacterized membrane protein